MRPTAFSSCKRAADTSSSEDSPDDDHHWTAPNKNDYSHTHVCTHIQALHDARLRQYFDYYKTIEQANTSDCERTGVKYLLHNGDTSTSVSPTRPLAPMQETNGGTSPAPATQPSLRVHRVAITAVAIEVAAKANSHLNDV
ncbi:unnamed protein product [Sphagnum balticum]